MTGVKPGAAVFLDRDGTIIRDVGYLRHVDQVEVLPRVPAALRLLRDRGFKLVLVTNQSAIARGWLTERDLGAIHEALAAQLARCGAGLDGVYYCPHHPAEGQGVYRIICPCRKPGVGMIERASKELGVDPAISYVVGDQMTDMQMAERIGASAVLIRGEPGSTGGDDRMVSTVVDLWEAAHWIIDHSKRIARGEDVRS